MSVCVKCLRPAELVYGGGAVMACMCNDVDTRASMVRYLRAMADRLNDDACKKGASDHRALLRDAALLRACARDLEQKLDFDPERMRELGIDP